MKILLIDISFCAYSTYSYFVFSNCLISFPSNNDYTSSYTLGEFAEDDSVHIDNWHLQKNLFTLYK